ncbi:hypothetical protein D6C97_08291 [Aureobasidium pullulans]|uniref:Uncharacterized protein n=1 Tax=Aureobasidium pullulans TaxID=5580 RepID=A0A4V4K0V4_AURPU|nr:hypothetical protein D6D15_05597 [Aureobasidium pullulans]THY46443.1 hypothetical protein D6C97_08291 [Aureobasidium pullulans]
MVSTRRAQTSATPPTTPSAERTAQVSASVPGSSKKMSKELRRLTIDANPSLGGVASSSSATRRSRRSGMRQELLPETQQDQAPHQLLPEGGVLLTPSPSDSPNSPHLRPTNETSTTDAGHDRVPSPAVKQTQAPAQTSNPQATPSIKSPVLTTKSAGKRKITQYFSAVPAQLKGNKRRKIDNSDLDPPTLQDTQSVPELPVTAPVPIPTAASAPEIIPDVVEEPEQKAEEHKDEPVAERVVQAVADTPEEKEPDKPREAEHEQNHATAEEDTIKAEVKSEADEKKAAKRERELKRLQIDAKPALIDKRSRRQTTLPLAREVRDVSEDTRPVKRQRLSLPAVAGPATVPDPTPTPAEVPEQILEEVVEEIQVSENVPSIEEVLATAPEPNPPVFPAGTDPKLLASGEVNDKWLTKWLGYVAHITGDDDTSRILTEEDAKELIKPDRSEESDQDRHKRISTELDVVAGWDSAVIPEEAIQSSPEMPEPVKPPIKKAKKQRFNPKPKGQPYIPKAKRKAMEAKEAKEKKLAAEKTEEHVQVAQPVESTSKEVAASNMASKAEEAVSTPVSSIEKPVAKQVETDLTSVLEEKKLPAKKEAEAAPTDWLTDLMNATETVKPEEEQPKKPRKTSKGKGKAKVV